MSGRPRAARPMPAWQQLGGFTLVELMIVVAAVAILAAIAIPQYGQYVMRAKRVEARTALLDLAARQERFFALNNAYSSDAAALGYGAGATFPLTLSSGGGKVYTIPAPTVTAGSATALPTYVALARPIGTQTADTQCGTYRLDHLGVQSNQDGSGGAIAGANCW